MYRRSPSFIAMGVGALVASLIAARAFFFGDYQPTYPKFEFVFVSTICLVFFVIGCVLLSSPWWTYYWARHIIYIVTNQRTLIFNDLLNKPDIFVPLDFGPIKIEHRHGDVGSIYFIPKDADDNGPYGFVAVADVDKAKEALTTLRDNMFTVVRGAQPEVCR
jgi:hypothetical protein